VIRAVRRDLEALLASSAGPADDRELPDETEWWFAAVAWLLVRRLAEGADRADPRPRVAGWLDELLLARVLERQLRRAGLDGERSRRALSMIRLLLELEGWWRPDADGEVDLRGLVERVVAGDAGRAVLGVNRHEGVLWFRAEGFDDLVALLRLIAMLETWADPRAAEAASRSLEALELAGDRAGYRVTELLEGLTTS
jgi:hypothetical protein